MSCLLSPNSTTQQNGPRPVVEDWAERSCEANDRCLQELFRTVLATSAQLPPDQRLVMYDGGDEAARAPLGPLRKRLDARRNTKPKKAAVQLQVCTPFDPAGFHFGKIRNEGERLLRLRLAGGEYQLLTNKFPLFPSHMLLVASEEVPQQLTLQHLEAVTQLVTATSAFCAYFNSWRASASVNHFHCHLIEELPPVAALPLAPHPRPPHCAGAPLGACYTPQGYPGECYVFPATGSAPLLSALVHAMQAANQPHNLLLTPRHVYLWPKPSEAPARSLEMYPETVGGPELLGSFTVYTQHDFDRLTASDATELTAINTATLPPGLLAPADLFTADAISYAPATPAAAHAPADAAGMAAAQMEAAEAAEAPDEAAQAAHEAAAMTVQHAKRAGMNAADMPPPSPPPTDCSPTRRRRPSRDAVACSLDVRASDESDEHGNMLPPQALLRLLSPKFPMLNGARRRDAGSGL